MWCYMYLYTNVSCHFYWSNSLLWQKTQILKQECSKGHACHLLKQAKSSKYDGKTEGQTDDWGEIRMCQCALTGCTKMWV